MQIAVLALVSAFFAGTLTMAYEKEYLSSHLRGYKHKVAARKSAINHHNNNLSIRSLSDEMEDRLNATYIEVTMSYIQDAHQAAKSEKNSNAKSDKKKSKSSKTKSKSSKTKNKGKSQKAPKKGKSQKAPKNKKPSKPVPPTKPTPPSKTVPPTQKPAPLCNVICGSSEDLIQLCHFDSVTKEFQTTCVDEETAALYFKTSQFDKCGSCNTTIASVIEHLTDIDSAEDAINSIDSADLEIVASNVRSLVEEDVKDLVTKESVLTSMFPNVEYHADLYPGRRLYSFFDGYPSGCDVATTDYITSALSVIFLHLELENSLDLASLVNDDLAGSTNKQLLASLFQISAPSWFGDRTSTANAIVSTWGQCWAFWGLKSIFNAMKDNSSNDLNMSTYLKMIAFSVTQGASLLENTDSLASELTMTATEGESWQNICFAATCDGEEPVCDSGDLCMVSRNRCDITTDWTWDCTHSAKICSPGYSCDPSDGACKADDLLVPCVAVIDEDSNIKHQSSSLWSQFRDEYPSRPFCLIIIEDTGHGTVVPPDNFLTDSLSIVHYQVPIDEGDTSKASNWVSMCGLDHYTSSNVGWVGLFIDDSGSMKEEDVEASRDIFYTELETRGIQVKKVVDPDENWILPFLTTLSPEEDASLVQLDQYVFWQSYYSENFNIVQQPSTSITTIAKKCSNDASCVGFNSDGWLKSEISPLQNWTVVKNPSHSDGLYIKSPTISIDGAVDIQRSLHENVGRKLYDVNRRQLTSEESKWIKWITTWTIPNFKMPRYDAVQLVSRGVWWALKEGVLNIATWNSLVSNPFHHNLCKHADGSQSQIGPLDICDTNTWQVGIAAEQPMEYSMNKLEDLAIKFYGSVDVALSQTAKQNSFYPCTAEYNSIMGSSGALRRAWLMKNHLVGFSLVSDKITKYCENPHNASSWCYGDYGGKCPSCAYYAPDAASIPGIIDEVTVLLQSLIDGECYKPEGYEFFPKLDSTGNDIGQQTLSISELAELCDGNSSCQGFNTNGWLKSNVLPFDEWDTFTGPGCTGFYMKLQDEQVVRERQLTSEESKWIKWITKWTIPNLKMPRYDAVQLVSRGVWWALKEGVLNIATSNSLVSNPFHHNLCKHADGSQSQIGPLDICDTDTWQVGIAAEQPMRYQLNDLQDLAIKFYGCVDVALSQTAKQNGYVEGSFEYTSIMGSSGALRRAWLMKNHLIGFYLISQKIIEKCEDPTEASSWCYGDYDGTCPSCKDYTPEVIDEVTVLLQGHDLEVGGCEPIQLDGYEFFPKLDSPGGNIAPQHPSMPLISLWELCEKNIECKGFNTDGWLKREIHRNRSTKISVGPSQCEGLYIKDTLPDINKVMQVAHAELNRPVIEVPTGANIDPAGRIITYITAAEQTTSPGYGWASPNRGTQSWWKGEYWCADFVSWVFKEAGFPLGYKNPDSPTNPEGTGFYNCRDMMNWLKHIGKWHKPDEPGFKPQRGDIIIFNWGGRGQGEVDHVGIVDSVGADGSVNTIEGNTKQGSQQGLFKKQYTSHTHWEIEGYGRFLGIDDSTPPNNPPPPSPQECSFFSKKYPNAKPIVEWLRTEQNIKDEKAIAVFLGNLQRESQLNPLACESGPVTTLSDCEPAQASNGYWRTGVGILQWSDPDKEPQRRTQFFKYGENNNLNMDLLSSQLEFMAQEYDWTSTARACFAEVGKEMGTAWDNSGGSSSTYWKCAADWTRWGDVGDRVENAEVWLEMCLDATTCGSNGKFGTCMWKHDCNNKGGSWHPVPGVAGCEKFETDYQCCLQ